MCDGVLTWICQNVVFFTLQRSLLKSFQSVSTKWRVDLVAFWKLKPPRCANNGRGARFRSFFVCRVGCGLIWPKGLCTYPAEGERGRPPEPANAHGGLTLCISFLPAFYGRGHMDLLSALQMVGPEATRWV